MPTFAVVFLASFLAGCAGLVSGTKTAIQAAFQLNPTSLSFGKVGVGKQTTQTVAVANTGNTAVSITSVSLSNPQFSLPGAVFPMALATGQSANMTVAVTPTTAGTVSGTMTAQGNNGSSPVTVNLSATAVNPAPQISLSSTSIQFTTVTVGSSANATLSISNVGTADLTISLISLAGAEFGVSGITTPKTITAGTSATANLTFQPTSSGAASGTLTITSNDPTTPTATVALSGTGSTTATAQFQASPTSVSFGNVTVGKSSTQSVTLTNSGTAVAQVGGISVSGTGISISGITAPLQLNPSASATFSVSFAPAATSSVTGSIIISGSATNSPLTIPVTGTGIPAQPGLSITPTSFAYGSVVDGQTKSQTFTLTNTGDATLTISQLAVSGAGYSVNGLTPPVNVAPGASTTFNAVFAPTTAGTLNGTVTVTSNAPTSPSSIALSGNGVTATTILSANPTSLAFGSVSAGSSSSKSVTLTNGGNTNLTISQVTVGATDTTTSGLTLPLTLTPGQTHTMNVIFSPKAQETVSGNVTVSTTQGASAVVAVSGTGTQAGFGVSPTSFAYGSVIDGQTKSQTFTLTNTGNATLTISQLAASGAGYSVNGLATPANVAPGGTTTFNAVFAPTTAGTLNGTVTVTSNAPGSPASIALNGTGVASTTILSANPTSLAFGNVSVGSSSSKSVTLTNSGNSNLTISQVTVSATDTTTSGITLPLTLTPGQTHTMSVTFSPKTKETVSGNVTVSTTQGASAVVAVSGTGTQAGLGVSPTSFAYGSVIDGQTKSQTFTLTNTGNATLTISQLAVGGAGYSVNGLATPANVAPGGTTTFNAVFAPTTAGTLNGTVTVTSNAPTSPTNIALSGTGVSSTTILSANPTSLAFGNVSAGSSSSKSVTLTNSGNSNLTISQVTVSATDTTTSGITLPLTLTPGQTQTMNVTFSPKTQETVSGSATVSTTQGVSAVVAISGTGTQAKLTLTPSTANLGSVTVGSSGSQTIQVSNPGNAVLTITQATVSGVGFSTSGLTLPLSVNPGSSSTFNVVFQPTSAGSVSGSVSLVSNAVGSPTSLALSGTGVAATLTLSFSTTNISFGNVNIGSSSGSGVTITNTGNSNVQISGITVSGAGYTLSGASTPVTLTPSQTMTFSVIFTPATAGTVNGSVTVTSNAAGSPATITLSATGVTPVAHSVSLTWTASTTTGVVGYNVYRSTTNGTGYAKINGSVVSLVTYTDSTVSNSTTYYYVTTSVDGSGNESSFSNQASAIIP